MEKASRYRTWDFRNRRHRRQPLWNFIPESVSTVCYQITVHKSDRELSHRGKCCMKCWTACRQTVQKIYLISATHTRQAPYSKQHIDKSHSRCQYHFSAAEGIYCYCYCFCYCYCVERNFVALLTTFVNKFNYKRQCGLKKWEQRLCFGYPEL